MKVLRRQWPVGQGCFATGAIERRGQPPFHYVYDCGARNRAHVQSVVASYADEVSEIDALFISHLDGDHVDGLDTLLARCRARTVYLPYLSEMERLIELIEADMDGTLTASLIQASLDPARWFGDRGTEQLVFIRNSGEGGISPEAPSAPPPEGGAEKFEPGPVDIQLEGKIEPVDGGTGNDGWSGSVSCLQMEVGGAVTARAHHGIEWILLPFVPPVDRARAAAFEKAIRAALNLSSAQPIGAKLLQDRLQTAEGRLLLRGCYDKIIAGGASASHNRISMSLYSGPLPANRPQWQLSVAWPGPAHPFGWMTGSGPQVGWIAAGDAKLNGDDARRQWLDFYRHVRMEVGTFLLPHHGSRHNFHADLLGHMPVRWGIAAADPREEGYHHPSLSVVEALRRAGCRLVHVTKDPVTFFEERISPIDR